MQKFDLGFALIYLLDDNLAEVIINEGVEMDITAVEQYHDWIDQHMNDPCFLLVNKINQYTYTFDAQRHLIQLDKVKAIAVVCYSPIAEKASRFVVDMPRKIKWQFDTFDNRKAALQWLAFCQDELKHINPKP
ncbi:MAG: hypothetical protein HRT35_33845 [Algicola sp.]|nr:hypothetical protein [Algicola sp.]